MSKSKSEIVRLCGRCGGDGNDYIKTSHCSTCNGTGRVIETTTVTIKPFKRPTCGDVGD